MAYQHTIIPTTDGSHTLYVPELDETYHSRHGAIAESRHVFIDHGLKACSGAKITILEVGFGTGLNCLLTLLEQHTTGQSIHYYTLEPFPLFPEIVAQLNYTASLPVESSDLFRAIHAAPWHDDVLIAERFLLTKLQMPLSALNRENLQADVVYFDAFAPGKQPELWSTGSLQTVKDHMGPNGILVTYCSQGQFKRNLKALGFETTHPAGPHGKREMTVALLQP